MATAPRRRSFLLLAAAVLAAAPAAADWLVMHDGSKVETKGAWEVRGALIVFRTPSDSLASVRLRDADLDASQEATAKAAAPAEPVAAKPAERKSAVTITDADVGHVDPPPATPPAAEPRPTEAGATPGTPPAKPRRLQVAEWHQDLDASKAGVVLVGEVRNISREVVGEIKVSAKLLDEAGNLLATAEALVGTSVLQPGQHTVVRASFPGVYDFSKATFDADGFALRSYAGADAPKNP
jgi:hypothetical protein